MGRQKRLSLDRIADDKSRNSCFSKRKLGLFSKAFQLGKLCGCDIAIVIRTDRGQLHTFENSDMKELLQTVLATNENVKSMTADDIEKVRYTLPTVYFTLTISKRISLCSLHYFWQ